MAVAMGGVATAALVAAATPVAAWDGATRGDPAGAALDKGDAARSARSVGVVMARRDRARREHSAGASNDGWDRAAPARSAGVPMAAWDRAGCEPSTGVAIHERDGVGSAHSAGASMPGRDAPGGVQETGVDDPGGRVVRVAVSARAPETGAVAVSMTYRLRVEPGTRVIPFTGLLFAPTTVDRISARVGGEALPVRPPPTGEPRMEGGIELPADLSAGGPVSLDLEYRVLNAVVAEGEGVRVTLPMLAVDWAPEEARPGVFQADVTLPEGMEAREIFPVTPTGGTAPGMARATLQVVPAVVRVRARPEGSLALSLPGALELLVLVVVIACGMAGLRRVRRAG